MDLSLFAAWMTFAIFTVWWKPRFPLPKYSMSVFALTCGAVFVLVYLLIDATI